VRGRRGRRNKFLLRRIVGFLDEKRCARCGKSEEYVSLDRHHVITKSRGGTKTIYLCRECHNWVGDNPDKAEKLGLYKRGYKFSENQNDKK
jgi:5-methylcytosine-specific restriction endonuclease McrA